MLFLHPLHHHFALLLQTNEQYKRKENEENTITQMNQSLLVVQERNDEFGI